METHRATKRYQTSWHSSVPVIAACVLAFALRLYHLHGPALRWDEGMASSPLLRPVQNMAVPRRAAQLHGSISGRPGRCIDCPPGLHRRASLGAKPSPGMAGRLLRGNCTAAGLLWPGKSYVRLDAGGHAAGNLPLAWGRHLLFTCSITRFGPWLPCTFLSCSSGVTTGGQRSSLDSSR